MALTVALSSLGCTATSFRPDSALRLLTDDQPVSDIEDEEAFDLAMRHCSGAVSTDGNRVSLLTNGEEAFPAMLLAIRSARKRVSMETFILKMDDTGTEFVEALAEAAGRGVEVRFLTDAVGSYTIGYRDLRAITEAGGKVRFFNPLLHWTLLRANNRDHRKILVVDARIAFVGGLNLADEYDGNGRSGWRDTALSVEGPAVRDLEVVFADSWNQGGTGWIGHDLPLLDALPVKALLDVPFLALGLGRRFDPPRGPTPPAGESRVWVIGSRPDDSRSVQLDTHLLAINSARTRVYVTASYFVPPLRLLRALNRAARRGINVRILLPKETDEPLVGPLARQTYGSLLDSGVRLYEWPHSVLHAKSMVVDGRWVCAGSCNLNPRGFYLNYEVNIAVDDADLASLSEQRFLEDIAASEEVTPEVLRGRPPLDTFRGWLYLLFRDQS
ncbi:MAG: phospholipase D-like domain-containing protein [Planctomycetota bacterium]